MAGKSAILAIRIISDATKAAKGFQQTETAADKMGKRLSKASKVGALALGALAAAGIDAAKNAASDKEAQVLLAKAMTNAAGATKAQVAQMEAFISSQSRAAGVSDDELRPALAALVRSTGNVAQAQAELKAALDVSAQTGKPVVTVANAIAKAHSGQTSALSRLVPGISQAAIKSKDMNKIMAELARTTGGSAAAATKTEAGRMRVMKINIDEAREAIGGYLLPVLGFLSAKLANAARFTENHSKTVVILASVIGGLAVTVITLNAGLRAYQAVQSAVMVVQKAGVLVTAAQTAAQYAMGTAWFAGRVAALGYAAATRAVTAAMAANPVGVLIVALIAVAALFVLAYKKSATFRAIVQAAGKGAAAGLGFVVDKAKVVITWLGKLGPAATKGKDVAVKAFKLYISPIQLVIDIIKKLVGWISKIHFPKVPKAISSIGGIFGGPGPDGPPPPRGGGGGSSPGFGHGGPGDGSFTIPVGGGRSGGTVIYLTVNGAIDPYSTAKQIEKILSGQGVRMGGVV